VLLQTVDQRDGKLVVDILVLGHQDEAEVFVHPTLDPVCPKTEIHIFVPAHVGIVLVEHIVETLIESIQVAEHHLLARLHADLDSVDVGADLRVLLVLWEGGAKDYFLIMGSWSHLKDPKGRAVLRQEKHVPRLDRPSLL